MKHYICKKVLLLVTVRNCQISQLPVQMERRTKNGIDEGFQAPEQKSHLGVAWQVKKTQTDEAILARVPGWGKADMYSFIKYNLLLSALKQGSP